MMLTTMTRACYVFAVVVLAAIDVRAETFAASLDQARWDVQRSPLACRLSQKVPRFGEATFEALGGGRQRFLLRAQKNPLAGGPSQLQAVAPSWNPNRQPVAIGAIEITEGAEPLQLGAEPAKQLLESLNTGLMPTFARPLRDDTSVAASVALSPVNFRSAYRQYTECIGQLLPFTFDDMKNTIIEFPLEQAELSASAQKKIDALLRYIALDRSVNRFEISGVSSDKLRRLDNLLLAKERVQQVSDYLMSRGVDAKAIESSYRGERKTKSERRVVSIRLKRNAAP